MADPSHPVISRGSRGDAVRLAQQRLVDRGYGPCLGRYGVDGVFGPCTDWAVKTYQRDRGTGAWGACWALGPPLNPDGVVGEKTWARLDPPTIHQGSTGGAVRLLQAILDALGVPRWNPGPIDGIFGPLTERAVRNYQDDNPNLDQDGWVGPKTWGALRS